MESLADAWNRHDAEAYAGHRAEDADFVNVLGMRRYNRAELRAEISWLHAARFAATLRN